MEPYFITGIWLATFENEYEFADYVSFQYPDNGGDEECQFANDIGLKDFDEDFLECAFEEDFSALLPKVEELSFAGHFKTELLARIKASDSAGRNAILALSGRKDDHGGINEALFDLKQTESNKAYLQFMGLFQHAGEL